MRMGSSIRPTIFDVYADPTLVMPMTLANLMSPRLWDLSARIDVDLDLEGRLQAYQAILDKYFRHLSPAEVAEFDGTISVDEEARRLGADVIDNAIEGITRMVTWRTQRGTLSVGAPLLEYIKQGRFPNYVYGTIDELHAHRQVLGRARHRPLGITSCLDEAVLFTALVSTAPVDDIDGIVLFGSASHYTVLIWSGEPSSDNFRAWWLYGKNRLYSDGEYASIVRDDYDGDAQLAFADRLPDADLMVTRRGAWRWKTGVCAWPTEERERVVAAVDRFFCGRIQSLDDAIDAVIPQAPGSGFDELFERTLGARDADEVRSTIRSIDSSEAKESLMCFRDTESIEMTYFLSAAQRGERITDARTRGMAVEQLLSLDSSYEPVLPTSYRVAMPEEVLTYGRGGPRDRELLRRILTT